MDLALHNNSSKASCANSLLSPPQTRQQLQPVPRNCNDNPIPLPTPSAPTHTHQPGNTYTRGADGEGQSAVQSYTPPIRSRRTRSYPSRRCAGGPGLFRGTKSVATGGVCRPAGTTPLPPLPTRTNSEIRIPEAPTERGSLHCSHTPLPSAPAAPVPTRVDGALVARGFSEA